MDARPRRRRREEGILNDDAFDPVEKVRGTQEYLKIMATKKSLRGI